MHCGLREERFETGRLPVKPGDLTSLPIWSSYFSCSSGSFGEFANPRIYERRKKLHLRGKVCVWGGGGVRHPPPALRSLYYQIIGLDSGQK